MNPNSTDTFWNAAAPGCEHDLARWLRDHGSLTRRIQERCTSFAVRNVYSGLARVALDESALLGIAPQQLAYVREVYLYADNRPVVFAHSVVAREHLYGTWAAVRSIGSKPLGAMLFAHPLVERKPLHYKALRANHSLYQHAAAVLSDPPGRLWARRSLFHLHGAPLLVTEVFLPDILNLARYARRDQ